MTDCTASAENTYCGRLLKSKDCVSGLLFLMTIALFWQTGAHDFINYDDPHYITHNPHVASGLSWQNIRWAFTTIHASNWHPLTWLSHMVDVELYGLEPRWHHLISVIIHGTNVVLLFLLLARTTGKLWPSAFAAALFALHPLRVEPVAWASERKEVLSFMFALLTLLAYTRYTAQTSLKRYLPVVFLFSLSLLTKPMPVTLPFVMLLLDYWPLRRFSSIAQENPGRGDLQVLSVYRKHLAEKLPLLFLSAVSSVCTLYAQQGGAAIVSTQTFPLLPRIENVITAYIRYLGNMLFPVDMAVFYPLTPGIALWKVLLSLSILVAVTYAVVRYARTQPYLITGWLWYLGTLVPVIGLVQTGMQSMADRYTYYPMVGIAVMLAWGAKELTDNSRPFRCFITAIAVAWLMVLGSLTWRQLHHWKNSTTLFSHAIRVTENNFIAFGYLGLTLHDQKRYQEAVKYYRLSLCINMLQIDINHNLGLAYRDLGESTAAIHQFEQTLKINPNLPETRYELAALLTDLDKAAAAEELREALKLQPDLLKARQALEQLRSVPDFDR